MTRIIALCLMLFATPAWAAGAWSPGSIPAGSCSTFTWASTDAADAQPPLLVLAGELAITAEVTSGTPSVAFYLIKGANGSDTPASTGTLTYTATATSRSPTYISVGGGYVLDPDIDTAGAAGGTVTVCSSGYASGRRYHGQVFYPGPSAASIQAAIDSCGEGTNTFGCEIQLPRQAPGITCTNLTSQIVIGDESGTTTKQNSITLRGYGFSPNDGSATRLCYTGAALAAGEGVIQVTGQNHQFIGFSVNANDLADYGLHIEGSNAASAISNGGVIRGFGCSDAIVACIQFGDGTNDVQADLWDMSDLRISEPDVGGVQMDYCIRFSSPNAVANSIRNLECSYYEIAGVAIPGSGTAVVGGQVNIYDSVFLTLATSGAGSFAIDIGPNSADGGSFIGNRFELYDGGCFRKQYLGGGATNRGFIAFHGNSCLLGDSGNATAHFSYDSDASLSMVGNLFTEASGRSAPPTNRVVIGNSVEATNPAEVQLSGNQFGGVNSLPFFSPTINNSIAVNNNRVVVASSSAITNTTTETAFSNCGNPLVLATSASIGMTVRMRAGGTFSDDAVTPGTMTIRARWGTANTDPLIADLGPGTTLLLGATSDGWTAQVDYTIRTLGASGTLVGGGNAWFPITATAAETLWDNQASTTTIDTTANKTPTLFAKWSVADIDNTITAEYCTVEVLRQ